MIQGLKRLNWQCLWTITNRFLMSRCLSDRTVFDSKFGNTKKTSDHSAAQSSTRGRRCRRWCSSPASSASPLRTPEPWPCHEAARSLQPGRSLGTPSGDENGSRIILFFSTNFDVHDLVDQFIAKIKAFLQNRSHSCRYYIRHKAFGSCLDIENTN